MEIINSNERERIGSRIAELRKERKLSQRDLALTSGLTPANIARIELGKYSPGLDMICKIAQALDKRIDFV